MIKCKRINSVLWEIGIVLFIALGASSAATINFPKAGTVPNNYVLFLRSLALLRSMVDNLKNIYFFAKLTCFIIELLSNELLCCILSLT